MKILRHLLSVSSLMQLPKAQRRIIFYSEGKSYWPHLQGLVQEFLQQSSIPVCYVSSSKDDPGLALQHPNLKHFQIDEGWIRDWFFANIDTDVMVMTMPDLQHYQVKRSKHPVHYVYVHHSLVSCHMVYRPGAFDHYDTIFCAGPHHVKEIRAIEQHYQLNPKNLIEHGYGRLDAILAQRNTIITNDRSTPHILIAPSWGVHGIIETVGEELVSHLLANNFQVTLRPHPQTFKFAKHKIDLILNKHKNNALFSLEASVAGQQSLHQSHIMVSDWSGAALDYAFGLEKPLIFIDVPKKINNPDYTAIPIEPFEVSIREKIGTVIACNQIQTLNRVVIETLQNSHWQSSLTYLREQHVFNVEKSAQAGTTALRGLLA